MVDYYHPWHCWKTQHIAFAHGRTRETNRRVARESNRRVAQELNRRAVPGSSRRVVQRLNRPVQVLDRHVGQARYTHDKSLRAAVALGLAALGSTPLGGGHGKDSRHDHLREGFPEVARGKGFAPSVVRRKYPGHC